MNYRLVLEFGERNPDCIVPRPDSPNSSTHSATRRQAIDKANREFGHEALYLALSESPNSSVTASESYSEESLVDFDGALVGVRTVTGGTSIFRALLELSEVKVHDKELNWYKVTTPAAIKKNPTNETGGFLLGYTTIDTPIFEYADKLVTRNVGLQVWPAQTTVGIQSGQNNSPTEITKEVSNRPDTFEGPIKTIPVTDQTSHRHDLHQASVELEK